MTASSTSPNACASSSNMPIQHHVLSRQGACSQHNKLSCWLSHCAINVVTGLRPFQAACHPKEVPPLVGLHLISGRFQSGCKGSAGSGMYFFSKYAYSSKMLLWDHNTRAPSPSSSPSGCETGQSGLSACAIAHSSRTAPQGFRG